MSCEQALVIAQQDAPYFARRKIGDESVRGFLGSNTKQLLDEVVHDVLSFIWRENMHGSFARGHYLFQGANSFPKAQFEETCFTLVTFSITSHITFIFN